VEIWGLLWSSGYGEIEDPEEPRGAKCTWVGVWCMAGVLGRLLELESGCSEVIEYGSKFSKPILLTRWKSGETFNPFLESACVPTKCFLPEAASAAAGSSK